MQEPQIELLATTNLVEMGQRAAEAFRQRYPEVSDTAIQALTWCYTFDYK